MRGLFITGTDTGVGKTILSAALVAAMVAAGESVRAHKPVVTGLEEQGAAGPGAWPADHELLAAVAGMEPREVSPLRFGTAAAPHLAARLAGFEVDPQQLLLSARSGAPDQAVVVEGVGGLLVPLAEDFTVCDLAEALALPVVIAARPGLGTINHTLLTLRAARGAGLAVAAVVLTPWPHAPTVLERSNRETISRLGTIDVATLAPLSGPDPGELARAGAQLPWREWLQAGGTPV